MKLDNSTSCLSEQLSGGRRTIDKVYYVTGTVIMNLTFPLLFLSMTLIGILISPMLFFCLKIVTAMKNDQIIRQLIWVYGRFWLLIIAPFVQFHKVNITKDTITEGSIFVVNHLSFFDTYCMGLLPLANISFAVGSWPFRILCFRPFMLMAKYMEMGENSWPQTKKIGMELLSEKCALLFFPEGHRSCDGSLGRFHSGAFKLSVETGVPIVPLCITGTGNLLPPGRNWVEPSKVDLRALLPVDPKDFISCSMPHLEMRKQVRKQMAEVISQMQGIK
jgi:1-acyl-sn-glycerol-3-phosphate acyltransferase